MTQTTNAATELTREHDAIDRLAVRIATLGPGRERAALVHQVCVRFLDHVRVEERFLYPVLRGMLRGGRTLAQVQADRNRALARTIEAVERGGAEGDELDILVGHLLIGLEDHVDLQDAVLLPELLGACSSGEIGLLGEQLHDGIRTAREAAERAADPAAERAAEPAAERAADPSAERAAEPSAEQAAEQSAVRASGDADRVDEAAAMRPEQRGHGFGGLFRRLRRAHRPADTG